MMTNDDYQALIAGAQAELERTELKLYFNVYVSLSPLKDHALTLLQIRLLRAKAQFVAPSLDSAASFVYLRR